MHRVHVNVYIRAFGDRDGRLLSVTATWQDGIFPGPALVDWDDWVEAQCYGSDQPDSHNDQLEEGAKSVLTFLNAASSILGPLNVFHRWRPIFNLSDLCL